MNRQTIFAVEPFAFANPAEFVESEADYGAAATQQKVRWYQTILKIVTTDPTISINGNHNDAATRAAMRKLQAYYHLEPTSYLTVASNAALTQMALEWIYRVQIPNMIGQWSSTLTDWVKQFQRDYSLAADGQVGALNRAKTIDVLLAKLPTPVKNFHSQLGPANLAQRQAELFELDGSEAELEPSGIHGRDDRRAVMRPAESPWRWICRIKIDNAWAGTGLLISPRHVLTAGHVVYGDQNDSEGYRHYSQAKTLAVSLAFDGHLLRKNRQFNEKAPFGTWPVDMQQIFIPSCYTHHQDISSSPPTNDDCDLAVLTLKTAIGTQKFTAKKTVIEEGRRKHIFQDFAPLG